jgi:glycine/D-amino acid oxidase-like deaminating enzyme
MTTGVVIVGAGIVGAACAHSLAAAGVDVTVVDRSTAASGTSAACEGNLLLSDKGPGSELRLAQYSASLWPALARQLQAELGDGFPSIEFEEKGGLVVATTQDGASALLDFAARQREAGVDAVVVDAATAHELEPELTTRMEAAVSYPQDAQVQPTIAAEALLASARAHGARLVENCAVTGPLLDGAGALAGVQTAAGSIRATRVLLAAGPWSGPVSALLGAPMPVRPRRGEVLVTTRMPQRVFHKVYDADYVGAVSADDAQLRTSSVVESTLGGTVLIGSSRRQQGFDARLEVDVLGAIAAKALRLFPFLADATILRTYGGFRPFMPDHLPVIGEDPRMPGLWHASGHEGAGIGLSLATAELIRDLMLARSTAIDPAPYSAARSTLAPHLLSAVRW